MSGEICVSKYHGNNGKLFRDFRGIVYTLFDGEITALGYDNENIGIISPIDSDGMIALVPKGVNIDSSLARKCKLTDGLSASCFQTVGGVVLYVPINPSLTREIPRIIYEPASLSDTALYYIITKHQEVKFDLEVLPLKLKNYINFSFKLSDKKNEFSEAELKNNTLIEKFETSYLNKMAGIKSTHQQLISTPNDKFSINVRKLEGEHFQAMEELKKVAADEKAKILSEICKLEILRLKSS